MFWAILMFRVLVKIISDCFLVILMFKGLIKFISGCFGLIDVWSFSKNYF